MHQVIADLAAVCSEPGLLLKEKWLLAPSRRAGYQWIDAVVRTGKNVVNVHPKTMQGMIIDMARPYVTAEGRRMTTTEEAVLIIDNIINRLRRTEMGYFTRLPATLSLARSIYLSIRDIRQSDVDIDSVETTAFERPEKAAEITTILRLYTEALDQHQPGLVDYPAAIDAALRHLSSGAGPIERDVCLLVPDNLPAELTTKEKRVLNAFPLPNVRGLRTKPVAGRGNSRPKTSASLLQWVVDPSKAPAALHEADGSVAIFTAAGEANEVREVFRRCMSRKLRFDQVEVLYTDPGAYVPLIYEHAVRLKAQSRTGSDLMVTFGDGIPAVYARPGKALIAWATWIMEDCPQSALISMFREDLLAVPSDGDLDNQTAARMLGTEKIGLGRHRYVTVIKSALARREERLAQWEPALEEEDDAPTEDRVRLGKEVAAMRRLLEFLEGFIGLVPAADAPMTEVLDAARVFLKDFAPSNDELDRSARDAILNSIEEMRGLVDRWKPEDLNVPQWLASLPRDVRIMSSGPRPGAIHVAATRSGGHSNRPHTFILGLDDGRFPGPAGQDPILLDSERGKLSNDLPTSGHKLHRDIQAFSELIARLPGDVTLSYSCRNISDDGDMFPSPLLLNAYRLVWAKKDANYTDFMASLKPPASFVSADITGCWDLTEWWPAKLCTAHKVKDADGLLKRHFPNIAKGKAACEARILPEIGIYDGMMPEPEPELSPYAEQGPVVSSSGLETLGSCPRRYFFHYILQINPPPVTEINKDEWLDRLEFGNLLHRVLYHYVSVRMKRPWPPNYGEELEGIRNLAAERAEWLKSVMPPPSEAVYQSQVEDLLAAVDVFLDHESKRNTSVPMFLEASLGRSPYRNGTSLDSERPIELKLADARTIRVRGRIDRVDRIRQDPGKQYEIWDYKSESAYKHRDDDPFLGGRVIQHGLYVILIEKALKMLVDPAAEVTHFHYLFPGIKERGAVVSYDRNDLSRTEGIIEALCTLAASGTFFCTDDPGTDCTYCPYVSACGGKDMIAESTKAKAANKTHPALNLRRGLRKIEKQ
ncbi:MAG: PD-(D/E)XK nuclease family protein [Pseudomonadota bacterium]